MSWLHWVLIPFAVLLAQYLLQRGLRADAEQVGEWKMLRPGPKDYAIVLGGLGCLVFLLTMVQLGLTQVQTDSVELVCFLVLMVFLGGVATVVWFLSFARRMRFNTEQIEWVNLLLRRRSIKLSEIANIQHNFSAGWSRVWSASGESLTILHSNHGVVELLQLIGLPNDGSSLSDQA
jgi:hypothetical protein